MNELNKYERDTEKLKIESLVRKQQQQEFKFIGDLRPLKGHTLFEINPETLEIKPAKYKENKTIEWHEALKIYKGDYDLHREVVVNSKMVYISALNAQSALERYKSGKGSAKMNEKKPIDIL